MFFGDGVRLEKIGDEGWMGFEPATTIHSRLL